MRAVRPMHSRSWVHQSALALVSLGLGLALGLHLPRVTPPPPLDGLPLHGWVLSPGETLTVGLTTGGMVVSPYATGVWSVQETPDATAVLTTEAGRGMTLTWVRSTAHCDLQDAASRPQLVVHTGGAP